MKKYGQIISELRKKKGFTQEQLGKKLNVSYQAVSKWENNLSEPDLETLEKLTEVFEISMSDFFAMSKDGNNDIYKSTINVSQAKEKTNSFSNFIKTRPWVLVICLSVLAVALLFIAIFVPFKLSAEAIYNKVNPSIFYIKTQTINGYSNTGTGFFINDSGLAVVDYDVVENCESGYIKFSDDEKYNIKYLVGVDEDLEIAIIQIDVKKSKGVSVANSNRVSIAEKVYTIGYSSSSESSLAETLISKVNYSNKNKYFQILTTSARDGSVLVNEQGKVVGMVSDRFSGDAGFDVAIPINNIKNIKHKYKVTLKEYYEMHKTFYFYSEFHDYTKEYVVGEKIEPLEVSSKGYSFDGWYTDETYTTKFDFSKPITTQNCCYAKWIPNTYTIKFDNGGGTGTMQDLTATYDMEMELPTASFTKQFHKFIGWKREGSDELLADCSTIKNLASEEGQVVTLKATWEMIKYTIYFDPNGGSTGTDVTYYEQIFIYNQQQILHPNQYSKQGYKFAGWLYNGEIYRDRQLVEKLCETEKRIDFVAQWTPIKYTIKFTYEGQSYAQEFVYDQPAKLMPNIYKKENYYFSNWSCSELWNLIRQSSFADEEEVLNLTDIDGRVFEFKACLYQNYYYIRYNGEDSYGKPSIRTQTLKYTEEGSIYSSSNKQGYLFSHWIDGSGKVYNYGDKVVRLLEGVGQYLDLYVQWKEITYTASYRAVHKNQLIESQDIGVKTYNEEFVLIDCPFEIDGYQFDYYKVYSKTFNPGDTVSQLTSTNNSTVYIDAVFVAKNYMINFDGNGATGGEMQPLEATFDSSVTIPENSFVKDGYTFLGWQFNDNFYTSTTIGLPITKYQDTITLTACWVENLKGEGKIDNPYTISTIEDLNNFANISTVNNFDGKYVVLKNDIDCEFEKLKPINFAGVFDGQGHKLINVDYLNGALFNESKGVIQNFGIENLFIERENTDSSHAIEISGLVHRNSGFIYRCYVKGTINIITNGNVDICGMIGSNIHNYNTSEEVRQIEYCFADLNVTITAQEDINYCYVYGFATGYTYSVDYNYGLLNLTTNLKNVERLKINAFGSQNDHSFAQANINVSVDNVTSYDFAQTATYYSDDSQIKLMIGEKSVPNLVETTTALSNLKEKNWMQENLFNINGAWVYDGTNFPVPSYTFQNVIDTQEQFIALFKKDLKGEYILNCDIDLTDNKIFKIYSNYGVFDGNGHVIKNYTLAESEYENIYSLFQTNYGIIKNLGIENLSIDIVMREKVVKGAGLVYENYGIINACFVRGSIEIDNIDGDSIVGGIVAVSKGGRVLNSYSDVAVYAQTSSDEVLASCYAGGIIATGEGLVENCFSLKSVSAYAHYTTGKITSAYGLSGAEGKAKNSFVLANVSVNHYRSSGEFLVGGISKEYENSFAYEWQKVTKIVEDLSFGDKSYEQLCSKEFLQSLNFTEFVSQENLKQNGNAVWIMSGADLPVLWFEVKE